MSKGSAELGDPFNSVACPVQEKLVKLIDWHPRIPTVEKLPSFLADYSVRYFTGLEPPQLTLAVRLLYHLFFIIRWMLRRFCLHYAKAKPWLTLRLTEKLLSPLLPLWSALVRL